jgi:hypothetical protein
MMVHCCESNWTLHQALKSHFTPLQWFGDFLLMDRVLDCNQFKPRQIRLINYCRLFLRVHTVAYVAMVEGTYIDLCLIHGNPSLLSSRSVDLERKTMQSWNTWKKAWANVDAGALHESLPVGPWKVPSISLRRFWPLLIIISLHGTPFFGHMFLLRACMSWR